MEDETCESQRQITAHIQELHEAVVEMKNAFTTAQLQLQSVSSEDFAEDIKSNLESTRSHCQKQSTDLHLILESLKQEVSNVKEAIQSTQGIQQDMQSSINALLHERDYLLEELLKNGAISESLSLRLRLTNPNTCPNPRPHSGCNSQRSSTDNDSGVAHVLEKAAAAFIRPNNPNDNVQQYLNGLCSNNETDQGPSEHYLPLRKHLGNPIAEDQGDISLEISNIVYDSDSSLTLAATKSLSLSNSIGKQCGLELDVNEGRENSFTGKEQEKGSGFNRFSDLSVSVSGGLDFKESQRLKVAKELLETERTYCQTLRTLQDIFAEPLRRSCILSTRDIETLFPEEIFEMHGKHCILLAQIEERVVSWNSQPLIGDIIERFTNGKGSDVLRLYRSYVNDFPDILKTFHKLCRSSRQFTQFLKASLEHPACGGLDLGAFLLSPVQRMPRYILLLKQISKYTEPSHPDFQSITVCLERLRNYLARLNDSMEHSFQLVTAQVSGHSDSFREKDGKSEKKIGISSALGLTFGSRSKKEKGSFSRGSVSSGPSRSSSRSTSDCPDENKGPPLMPHPRRKRSTSVPRNQTRERSKEKSCGELCDNSCGIEKSLKMRSKSDWTVGACEKCHCNGQPEACQNGQTGLFEKSLHSESEFNSDDDEDGDYQTLRKGSDTSTTVVSSKKFSTSKSLHEFPHENPDWFLVNQGEQHEHFNFRKVSSSDGGSASVVSRSHSNVKPGCLGRMHRISESEVNLHMIDIKKGIKSEGGLDSVSIEKKKKSLRSSLKNIFSLKKRSKQTLQISGPLVSPKPRLFCEPSHRPPPVATLRYNNGRECYQQHQHQSLPPEPISSNISITSRGQGHHQGSSKETTPQPSSLPPVPSHFPILHGQGQGQGQGQSRYVRNPKLPKTPYTQKYSAHEEENNIQTNPAPLSLLSSKDFIPIPYTDV